MSVPPKPGSRRARVADDYAEALGRVLVTAKVACVRDTVGGWPSFVLASPQATPEVFGRAPKLIVRTTGRGHRPTVSLIVGKAPKRVEDGDVLRAIERWCPDRLPVAAPHTKRLSTAARRAVIEALITWDNGLGPPGCGRPIPPGLAVPPPLTEENAHEVSAAYALPALENYLANVDKRDPLRCASAAANVEAIRFFQARLRAECALAGCAAAGPNSDGECSAPLCPQLRDGEPTRSRRHCPLDFPSEDEEETNEERLTRLSGWSPGEPPIRRGPRAPVVGPDLHDLGKNPCGEVPASDASACVPPPNDPRPVHQYEVTLVSSFPFSVAARSKEDAVKNARRLLRRQLDDKRLDQRSFVAARVERIPGTQR